MYNPQMQGLATCQICLQIGVDVSKHGGHAYPGLDKVYDDMLVHSEPHGAFNGKAGFAYPTGDGKSADSLLKARVRYGHQNRLCMADAQCETFA